MNSIRQHTIRYPNCRASTVRYLMAREAKTQQLLQEIEASKPRKPWWQRLLERIR